MTATTAFDVTMPQLGETVSEGTVIDWLKAAGDHITAGDALLEVSTDKVDTELPAPVSGTLTEILAQPGETVAVGSVIARIATDGEAPAAEPPTPSPAPAPAPEPAPAPPPPASAPTAPARTITTSSGDGARLRISPVARRLAQERQIDLSSVVGTGPDGAIVKSDIPATAAQASAALLTPSVSAHAATSITAQTHIDVASLDAASTEHPVAAFVIRALVDTLRHEAANHPTLSPFVEPSVRYVHASSGRTAALPGAAGLRISALTSELEASTDSTIDATVSILDSSDQSCAISGAASSAISVGIGPRQTRPAVTPSGTGVAIVFPEVVDVSVIVDGSQISVPALSALTNHLKLVLETRDWSVEV